VWDFMETVINVPVPKNAGNIFTVRKNLIFSKNKLTLSSHDVLLTVQLSIFILVINQLDAQNFCFTISLFHASTCFQHMCSSSGGQNGITQPVHETATYRCDDTRSCVIPF